VTVLLIGGTGKTGRRLAAQLHERGIGVRVATRNPNSTGDGCRFDWNDSATWSSMLHGITAAYLVPPPGMIDTTPLVDFTRLAQQRGCRRFVLLSASVLPDGGPGAGQVHAWLRENTDDWTVLRPSWFMENFSEGHHRATICREGRVFSATEDGPIAFVAAHDIAAAACVALCARDALNTDFILTGPAAITYDMVAGSLTRALGRTITHVQSSVEEIAARHRADGLPALTAQILAGMDALIAGGAENRTTNCVERLTGVAPMSFETFCRIHERAWI
jgi:ergot alkaloid biosynthesis protein